MTPLGGRGATLALIGVASLPQHHDGSRAGVEFEHRWRLVDGHHWQVVPDSVGEPSIETDAREGTRGDCREGMVAIVGGMKEGRAESIESLQNGTCIDWIDRNYPERCATFDRSTWLRVSARERLSTRPMQFCIDRFEYPNQKNGYPIIDVTWHESKSLCEGLGKRLCTESEWTFACEGEEATPYPTGYVRDPIACVIDRPRRLVDESVLSPRDSRAALGEIDRLWQGEISGSHSACMSEFGVHDLTGNVDEWTSSMRATERPSILKGGYWGPVRARCRPSTRVHGEDFANYQQGFRCCQDLE